MLNAAEIGALIIVVIGAIIGYRKGVIGIVYTILSWIFVVSFALFTNPYISGFITDYTPLDEQIEIRVSSYISEKADEYLTDKALEDLEKENNPEAQEEETNKIISTIEDACAGYLPKTAYDAIINPLYDIKMQIGDQANKWKDEIISKASEGVTSYIIRGISFLIAVMFAHLLCVAIGTLVNKIKKLPVIRGVSSIIGIFVGIFNALLVIWVIMYLVSISLTTDLGAGLYVMIYDSRALAFLYENNVFVSMILSKGLTI